MEYIGSSLSMSESEFESESSLVYKCLKVYWETFGILLIFSTIDDNTLR